jgi:Immunity protein Imm5
MDLSTDLIEAVHIASSKLISNANGELILSERKRIWSTMGELLIEGNRAIKGIGLTRRTKLASLCVRKVLGLWDEVWPDNYGTRQMLMVADQYLDNSIDFDSAWKRKNSFWGELDNPLFEGNYLAIVNVGFAAVKVVTTALVDEIFDPQNLEEDISDETLDPYQWDASFYAAAAYAGGAPWEEQSNTLRRREFWKWYLNEAVPSAWELQSSSRIQ